jgi:hypothetical protein
MAWIRGFMNVSKLASCRKERLKKVEIRSMSMESWMSVRSE